MKKKQPIRGFVPVLNTQAGGCLTLANWENLGVKALALHLDLLLMRPGIAFLEKVADIRAIYPWPHAFIIHCNLAFSLRKESYRVRSLYDGSEIVIEPSRLLALIQQLRPDEVAFSAGNGLLSQVSELRLDLENAGIFFREMQSFSPSALHSSIDFPLYCAKHLNFNELQTLSERPDLGFESDKPAEDGLQGIFYTEKEALNVLAPAMQMDYKPLLEGCQCPSCQSGFTRAYLHHLLQQTPLLAQRLLIQHNIWQFSSPQHLPESKIPI